jgi:hypothetical protein
MNPAWLDSGGPNLAIANDGCYATERERYRKAALHDFECCRKQVSVAGHAGRLAKLAAERSA